jgi:hypothetical protein
VVFISTRSRLLVLPAIEPLFLGCAVRNLFALVFATIHESLNSLTPNDLKRRRAVSPLKIKIPSKNMREKSTNTPIIYSVY